MPATIPPTRSPIIDVIDNILRHNRSCLISKSNTIYAMKNTSIL